MSELATKTDEATPVVTPPVEPTFNEAYYKAQLLSKDAQITSKDKKLKESNKLYQSKLSEDEKIKIAMEAKDTELQTLRRDKTVLGYSNSLTADGFGAKPAMEMASALADGDMGGFLKGFKEYKTSFEKTVKAGLVNNTPTPPSGESNNAVNLKAELEQAFKDGNNVRIIQLKREISEKEIK